MTPVPLSPSKMGTATICDPVTAAGAWAMAGSGRSRKTSSSVVVWDEETGDEDSDEKGSESEASGMGGRRLAGGPEDGSEGAVSGYPESLPEGPCDIHGKNLMMGVQKRATMPPCKLSYK